MGQNRVHFRVGSGNDVDGNQFPNLFRHLHAVIRSGQQALKPGGLIAMEHGYRQGEAVRRLLMEAGYSAPRTEQDLAGLDRCTWARRD